MFSYADQQDSSIVGEVLVKKPGLESYLRVQLAKYGLVVRRVSSEEGRHFLVTDSIGEREQQKPLPPLAYGVVYSESLKKRLAFLKYGFLAVFKFPVLIEELANMILNHFRLLVKKNEDKFLGAIKLATGLELIPTNHKSLVVLRYKNRLINLSVSEARVLMALFKQQSVGSRYGMALSDVRAEHLTSLVYRLRKKLARLRAPFCIKNIYGFGYFLRTVGKC